MRRRRRLWKTFYILNAQDYRGLQSAWQSWPRSLRRHEMHFQGSGGAGVIETNVPLAELRQMFRSVGAQWVDYASDVEREPDELAQKESE